MQLTRTSGYFCDLRFKITRILSANITPGHITFLGISCSLFLVIPSQKKVEENWKRLKRSIGKVIGANEEFRIKSIYR